MGRLPQTPSNQKKTGRPSLFDCFSPAGKKLRQQFHAKALSFAKFPASKLPLRKLHDWFVSALLSVSLLGVTTVNVKADESLIQTEQTTLIDIENENTTSLGQATETHNIQKRENDGRSPKEAMAKPKLTKGGAKCAVGIIGAGLGAVGGGVLGGISGAIGAISSCW